MKLLLLSFLLIISAPLFAHDSYNDKFACMEYDFQKGTPLTHTIVLEISNAKKGWTQTEDGEIAKYRLTQYENLNVYPSTLSLKGTVLTEDVIFQFTSEDEKYIFNIYLDELDQSSLTVFDDNKKVTSRSSYFCY